ncbi:hypothetical protein SBA6_1360002 [Candidatus Sulfopaludibacter sp. SbA6]|nr:hypothetical protein SBA6_1360002 [Candidatus Sulfopaludibacter sp. SbA6]
MGIGIVQPFYQWLVGADSAKEQRSLTLAAPNGAPTVREGTLLIHLQLSREKR